MSFLHYIPIISTRLYSYHSILASHNLNELTIYRKTCSGPTWKETRLSEAESYKRLALANGLFGCVPESEMEVAQPRMLTEERALDSYYNILFSLVHFWRKTGVWPEHLTIVSHAFKRARLVDGHCAAIGFPRDKITFIGINPPGIEDRPSSSEQNTDGGLVLSDQVSKLKGDVMTGVSQTLDDWVKDPHGIGEVLADKRRKRNPWGIDQSLFSQEERERSGVQTRFLEDGTEALVEGGTRPWTVASITGVEETAARTENRQE
jgi:hypothetical protein